MASYSLSKCSRLQHSNLRWYANSGSGTRDTEHVEIDDFPNPTNYSYSTNIDNHKDNI